jgi:hypothetical protein
LSLIKEFLMGYTHYWERQRILPRALFITAVENCRRLCAALNIPLGDGSGEGRPTFTSGEICFNGHVDSGRLTSVQQADGLIWPHENAHGVAVIGEKDAIVGGWHAGPSVNARVLGLNGDGSYETFHVARVHRPRHPHDRAEGGWWSAFCKTNYRPYDLCVQGCLIVLSHHLGNRTFRVSSDGTSPDWNDARDACQHVLGYGIDWGEGQLAPVPPPPAADQV